jgi:hypothetical protein
MTVLSLLVSAALAVASPAPAPDDGDVIRAWDDVAFQQVRANRSSKTPDGEAARAYAILNAAMYDAVNGTVFGGPERTAAIAATPRRVVADPVASAARAAHDVLSALYPDAAASYDQLLGAQLAARPVGALTRAGDDWGRQVAASVLSARSDDGSQGGETQPGGTGPGEFTGTWTSQYRHLAPFAIGDPDSYVGSGPPAAGSPEYISAYNEVKALGRAPTGEPTPADDQALATFRFWALGTGTDQPPGGWLQVAAAVSLDHHLTLSDTARLFALESMAMADTVGPTFETKHRFHSWRPTTAINATDDPTWKPRGGSPGGTPEHWSGHSTFSFAAATVLAGFFCDDNVSFSLTTDGQTQTRSYTSFSAAAAEAGRSRILGGLHFPFSDTTGRTAGRGIAAEVLSTALLREHGRTHEGGCPV